jgi:hypothetical protein
LINVTNDLWFPSEVLVLLLLGVAEGTGPCPSSFADCQRDPFCLPGFTVTVLRSLNGESGAKADLVQRGLAEMWTVIAFLTGKFNLWIH